METTAINASANDRQTQAKWIMEQIQGEHAIDLIAQSIDEQFRDDALNQKTFRFIPAHFKNLEQYHNVLVKIPPIIDTCLVMNKAHIFVAPNDIDLEEPLNILAVPKHWHRTLIPEKGVRILRNFYTKTILGCRAVADITVQIKTDLNTDRKEIVINYKNIRYLGQAEPQFIEKLYVNFGQITVPGTNKCIAIEPIKKKLVSQN